MKLSDDEIYAIAKNALTEIDNDPPEAVFHAIKLALREFREQQKSLQELAKVAREKRNEWHEDFGVPISHTYAEFLEAIGTLINVCESAGE